jgi:hypothetical protein
MTHRIMKACFRSVGLFLLMVLMTSDSFAMGPARASKDEIQVSGFKSEFQGFAPWCWAASASMVLNQAGVLVNGRDKKLCEIVSDATNEKCCGMFPASRCYSSGSAGRALTRYGQSYSTTYRDTQAVINAIRRNRLALLTLQDVNDPRERHSVVVRGIRYPESDDNAVFLIEDPSNGEIEISGADLKAGRYDGDGGFASRYTWTSTFVLD